MDTNIDINMDTNLNSILPLCIYNQTRDLIEEYAKYNAINNVSLQQGKNLIQIIVRNNLQEWTLTNTEIENEVNLWKSWFDTCYQLNSKISL